MFSDIKKQLKENFDKISIDVPYLFYVEIDRDKIFNLYLDGFDPQERQSYNCNCCKSFIRQYGGIVIIEGTEMKSIWDIDPKDQSFKESFKNISEYIHSLPVTDVFFNSFANIGTDFNITATNVRWEHFSLVLDKRFIKRSNTIDSLLSEHRASKEVLKRGLDEITKDSIEIVLDLISQNSLYRGREFEYMISKFLKLKNQYDGIKNLKSKDNFAWVTSLTIEPTVSRIRNTSIGTLLIDISKGVDLDTAVSSFERIMTPSNYKRPNSLISSKMVEEAKKTLTELGFIDSLERRFATPKDISVNNLLFVDRSKDINDVFEELLKETSINPQSLQKIEEIGIQEFIDKIIPNSKQIKLLLEDKHMNNFVSMLTSVQDSKPLFKWSNPFSWAYTGNITDSMKEKVKQAGGKIDGVLRFSIQWNEDGKSIIDLDAHANEPEGPHIYYASYCKDRGSKGTPMTGLLDVDMRSPTETGVENITWSDLSKMRDGNYVFRVHNFSDHKNFDGVRCEIEFNNTIHKFSYNRPFTEYIKIATVTKKGNNFTVQSDLDSKSAINSCEKWGLKSYQFHTVKSIMLSPNYWSNQIGNKHFIFALENCKNDESVRPFFNEFLNQDLEKHRKVFEIMGSKLKVSPAENQISGVGFSETQRNSVIVQVKGSFTRTLKINF